MAKPDNSQQFSPEARIEEILAALKGSASMCPPRVRRVTPIPCTDPKVGQVWQTQKLGGDAGTEEESYDPCWVLLLDRFDDYGELMYEAAPIFTETDMASEEDVVLPRYLLGFSCAVAIGTTLTVLRGSLKSCEGSLPEEWRERLLTFYRRTRAAQNGVPDSADESDRGPLAAPVIVQGLQVGLPYLDEADPAYEFHQDLVERLDYLQKAVLEWAHQPEAETLLERIVAGIKIRISNWLSIPWIPELEQWNADIFASVSAGEDEPFWNKARFAAPDFDVHISATPETQSKTCSFFVTGYDRNRSLALDGLFIVGADSKRAIPIQNARATLPIGDLIRGFAVVAADGSEVRIQRVD
jgi:hypothetical protein